MTRFLVLALFTASDGGYSVITNMSTNTSVIRCGDYEPEGGYLINCHNGNRPTVIEYTNGQVAISCKGIKHDH